MAPTKNGFLQKQDTFAKKISRTYLPTVELSGFQNEILKSEMTFL